MIRNQMDDAFNLPSEEALQEALNQLHLDTGNPTRNDIDRAMEILGEDLGVTKVVDNTPQAVDDIEPENEIEENSEKLIKSLEELKELENTTGLPIDAQWENELKIIEQQADDTYREIRRFAKNSDGKTMSELYAASNNFLNTKLNAKIARANHRINAARVQIDVRKISVQEQKLLNSEGDKSAPNREGFTAVNNSFRENLLK